MTAPALSIIVPAFNEARRLPETLRAIRAHVERQQDPVEILVVDDGSRDTTSVNATEALKDYRWGWTVLANPVNRGKGAAVRLAVGKATGSVIGYVDADNKTPIDEMDKLLPWLRQGHEIVIGSRAMAGSVIEVAQPFHRKLGSSGFGLIMHALVGLRDIPDTQCGFKFFTREAAKDIFARSSIDGYMFDIEVLCLAKRLGYRIHQMPIRWRNDADSRSPLISGPFRYIKELFWMRRAIVRARQVPAPGHDTRSA